MLVECRDPLPLVRRWAGQSLPRRVKAHWLIQGAAPEAPQPRWFTDDAAQPQVVMRVHGDTCTVHGRPSAVAAAFEDFAAGSLDMEGAWPDAAAQAAWDESGQRTLHLSRVDQSTLASARRAGFHDPPLTAQPHYCAHAWYIQGPPRFTSCIRDACRIVHGEELLELFLEDNARDEVAYIRACLHTGPSFVCEVSGQPVSWSLTHLGGAVGRIYTPRSHRGKGYAGSLVALQVDTLLKLRGIAVASVRVDNAGSYRIFQGLEGRHIRGPMTWSTLVWPS